MLPVFTPAHQMPWPVTPVFQMLPGMQRHQDVIFTLTDQDSVYQAAKQQAFASGDGAVGEADPLVLNAIAQRYQRDTGQAVAADLPTLVKTLPEDFVILHDETQPTASSKDAFRVRFLSVCFASNWTPAEKLGLNFLQIHEPVADNQRVLAAQAAIESMAFRQRSVRRQVWLLSPNPNLRQDPEQREYSWHSLLQTCGQDAQALLERVMFRVECQTTLPLPHLRRAVFFIRVRVCPLSEVLSVAPPRALSLRDALTSMSAAVLEYRGMQQAQPRLLSALASVV